MAEKQFKEIVDTKGYKLEDSDRKVFERELTSSFFGSSESTWGRNSSDVIEFILMDSADNVLPQGEKGILSRYIFMDDVNIKKYYTLSNLEDSTKLNGAHEYTINTDVLIKEAGYSMGTFKTQISLLNRRVGSESMNFDKLWIHEISPSRTEIRVIPLENSNHEVDADLAERYDVFVNEGNFRDDVTIFVQDFIESIDLNKVLNDFLTVKGTVTDGQSYINLIRKEFGINSFEDFLSNVHSKLTEGMQYFVDNKNYHILSRDYGNSLREHQPIQLSKQDVVNVSITVIDEVLQHLLPVRDIKEDVEMTQEQQETIDKLKSILKTDSSNSKYVSTVPVDETREDPKPIVKTEKYYVHSSVGSVAYVMENGQQVTWKGSQGESKELRYIEIIKIIGDVTTSGFDFQLRGGVKCDDPKALNYGQRGKCLYKLEKPHVEIKDVKIYPIVKDPVYISGDPHGRVEDINYKDETLKKLDTRVTFRQ